ncbi:unnamed protein product [Vitrella brassicaformis CCMP3155]|uniref:Uncharacterized protein n=1 Tax=Vitrella brassicaformis (strain CCMP3155) TaxID=1169540 RepID=A0A0G4F282_VITBC|nr:unnamed protein product [Vitrella brassicaformis CCMP3155]|eukprot:CEM05646.1 unnamed protein product [Vitrella brassicaformis CCMP3155]
MLLLPGYFTSIQQIGNSPYLQADLTHRIVHNETLLAELTAAKDDNNHLLDQVNQLLTKPAVKVNEPSTTRVDGGQVENPPAPPRRSFDFSRRSCAPSGRRERKGGLMAVNNLCCPVFQEILKLCRVNSELNQELAAI